MFGQHPIRLRVEHRLSALSIQIRPAPIASRPAAAAGELIRVKEIVGREKALPTVDRRLQAHREIRLTGEVPHRE